MYFDEFIRFVNVKEGIHIHLNQPVPDHPRRIYSGYMVSFEQAEFSGGFAPKILVENFYRQCRENEAMAVVLRSAASSVSEGIWSAQKPYFLAKKKSDKELN